MHNDRSRRSRSAVPLPPLLPCPAPDCRHEAFLRFTIVGYVAALLTSAFVLWVFGRFDGVPFAEAVQAIVVLGFPAAVGAAAARLLL